MIFYTFLNAFLYFRIMNRILFLAIAAGLFSCKSQKNPGISWGGGEAGITDSRPPDETVKNQNPDNKVSHFHEAENPAIHEKTDEVKAWPTSVSLTGNKPKFKPSFKEIRQLKSAVKALKTEYKNREITENRNKKPDWGEICLQGFVILLAVAAILLLLYLMYLLVGAAFGISLGQYMLFWLVIFAIIAIAVIAKK